jgi:hypothetical protein
MIWPFEQAEQSDGRGKYDGQRKRKGADALAALLNRFCLDDCPGGQLPNYCFHFAGERDASTTSGMERSSALHMSRLR